MHWQLTPSELFTFKTQSTISCWRKCGYNSTTHHIFWLCSCLKGFWLGILDILSKLTKTCFTLASQLVVINLNIELISAQFRLVVTCVLLAARLLIAQNWRTTTIPSLPDVIDLRKTHYTYERLQALEKSSCTNTNKVWLPWIPWYEEYSNT